MNIFINNVSVFISVVVIVGINYSSPFKKLSDPAEGFLDLF